MFENLVLYSKIGLLIDLLIPPHCLICEKPLCYFDLGKVSQGNERIFCKSCDPEVGTFASDTLCCWGEDALDTLLCAICGEPLDDTEWFDADIRSPRCLHCRTTPPPSRQLRSLWRYNGVVERGLKLLKYGGKMTLARAFSRRVHRAIEPNHPLSQRSILGFTQSSKRGLFPSMDWNCVIAVPSAPSILKARGFSHTTLIADNLARSLRRPLLRYALIGKGERVAQAGVPLKERRKNVSGKFIVDRPSINRKTVLLVDDILTTGSTLCAATEALLVGGAANVDCITVARSYRYAQYRNRCEVN